MATYQQLKQNPASRVLFNNRITTMEHLQSTLEDNVALFALDTEHVSVESQRNRILHQVGLAYLPTMAPHTPFPDQPRLDDFYHRNQLQSLTININLSHQIREDLTRFRGGVPNRSPSRFGHEREADLDDLESVIVGFIQSCNPSTKSVLVGFEMPAEWNYLSRNFPRIIPCFSSWIDLRDIAKDIAPFGEIPGRVSVLRIFGYHWRDIKGSNRYGSADNAGDDAVSMLAMANALLYPENQEKLRFRQKCSHIAHKYAKKHGPFVFKKTNIAFGATIQSKGLLPNTINSSMKLARCFFDFMPISTGLKSAEVAFIAFDDQDHLNKFIQANDGRSLPTGEILSVAPIERRVVAEGTAEREAKRRLREAKKVERSESEFTGLANLFLECNNT
ncbi:hypothetical protein F5X98DRAFT_378874 [Xylaria grammica]|nr:hypothetical protein F5X98DRAFT_378874 [Xylaria grammica]